MKKKIGPPENRGTVGGAGGESGVESRHANLDLTTAPTPRLKVWWIPQVPMKPFAVLVSSFAQAYVLLHALGYYDLFQFENRIKPDFSNAGGVSILEDGEWSDFYTNEGGDFDSLTLDQCIELDADWKAGSVNRAREDSHDGHK